MFSSCEVGCNKCCIEPIYDNSVRIYQNLTAEQAKQIRVPRTDGRCCLLTEDGKCRIQELFGYEAKSDICKNYLCKGNEDD